MIRAYTSRFRFDEGSRYTGVYQQMGRVGLDSDWNEEVRLRTVDAERRTHDLAHGSPDDGFAISREHLLDPITSIDGWESENLPADDQRVLVTEGRLDRRDPETLPHVLRTRGHVAVRRRLVSPLDLTRIQVAHDGIYAASAVVFWIRFERLPTDDERTDVQVLLADADGNEQGVAMAGRGRTEAGALPGDQLEWPEEWIRVEVPVAAFDQIDRSRVTTWGVRNLPPRARVWVGDLYGIDPDLGNDFFIRGGDGTLAGAGRMLVEGARLFLESDLRYSSQPDHPRAPTLPALVDGRYHFFFLDAWADTFTHLDDRGLLDSALDGLDTTARLRQLAQVRARASLADGDVEPLPAPTGGGRLTTAIPTGLAEWPDRFPPERLDPCRDRCLYTENRSTQEGYLGADNLHVRVEIFRAPEGPVLLWSRDNGSSVFPLVARAEANATVLRVSPEDAARLRAGDLVVLEDRETRLAPDDDLFALPAAEQRARRPRLVQLLGVDRATGVLELEEAGTLLVENDPISVDVSGPVGRAFDPANGAVIRLWDGADALVTDVRYNLPDGVTFGIRGEGFRAGDFWTFTARVRAPDGGANGELERLEEVPPHGPVHRYVPLARAYADRIEDLRPRYLPLVDVRDRLRELGERRFGPAAFTVVVGDGVTTFGDVDQDLLEGVSGDEALQAAIDRLGRLGGTIYIRRGIYRMEHPVLVRGLSSVRFIGDGDATELRVMGSGGAFYFDRCGHEGACGVEHLRMIEAPDEAVEIGRPRRRRPVFPRDLLLRRPVPLAVVEPGLTSAFRRLAALPATNFDAVLTRADLFVPDLPDDFVAAVAPRILALTPTEGRVASSVVGTLIQLRRIQRENPGRALEDVDEARVPLDVLRRLPHGVVTIADSHQLSLEDCAIESRERRGTPSGVMITGTCRAIRVARCRIEAVTGVAVLPYAPFFARSLLARFPRAGLLVASLELEENRIAGADAARAGIQLAEGTYEGVRITGNEVGRFPVGISVTDVSEAAAVRDRTVIGNNRITTCTAAGIEGRADDLLVDGNEVELAASDALFLAGVQVVGHRVTVRDCRIALPATPDAPVLGEVAGIIVGDGVDDDRTRPRTVYDVEVTHNRIEGVGEQTLANGISIGGPQAIAGVRVIGNAIRNLGCAGIRAFGTGTITRLVIEENDIERVASGHVATNADNTEALRRLDAPALDFLAPAARARPRTLIEALLASARPSVRAPLDAALRWLERLTLRGGIVVAGVEDCSIVRNRLRQIGRTAPYELDGLDASEIRMAAIATAGGAEVLVEHNHVEDVRAPARAELGGADLPPSLRPGILIPARVPPGLIVGVLETLAIESPLRAIDRSDIHGTALAVRRDLAAYLDVLPAERAAIGRRLGAPIDALTRALETLGGTGEPIAGALDRAAQAFRTARGAQVTGVVRTMRAAVSQASAFTASDERATSAWAATARLDEATVEGGDALRDTAARLLEEAEALFVGAPAELRDRAANALEAAAAGNGADEASAALAELGLHFDVMAADEAEAPTGELAGDRRTVVAALSERLVAGVRGLEARPAAAVSREALGRLAPEKDALVRQLGDTNPQLSRRLEADFVVLDRMAGPTPEAVNRFRATLTEVSRIAAGSAAPAAPDADDRRRTEVQADAARLDLYVRHLDGQAAGLSAEPEASAQKGLRELAAGVDALVALAEPSRELAAHAAEARRAIDAALGDLAVRPRELGRARELLDRIRDGVSGLLPKRVPPGRVVPGLSETVVQQIAGAGSLTLRIREIGAGRAREQAQAALRSAIERSSAATGMEGAARANLLAAVDAALAALAGAGAAGARAQHRIAELVEGIGSAGVRRAGDAASEALEATHLLLQAAVIVLDEDDDALARSTMLARFAASRGGRLAPSLVAQLQRGDLERAREAIAAALDRIARDERPDEREPPAPAYDVRPEPADGIFVAGVSARGRVADNEIERAAVGVTLAGTSGHVLAAADPTAGVSIELDRNRITGCPVAGFIVDVEGNSSSQVVGNQVRASAGMPVDPTRARAGRSVCEITGRGTLLVQGNLLTDNGHRHAGTVLHELLIDWRGELVVRSNTVRHVGGGADGAGIVVIAADEVSAPLVARLASQPFLSVEPAPRVFGPVVPWRPELEVLRPPVLGARPTLGLDEPLQLGMLRQSLATTPVTHRALVVETAPSVRSEAARAQAAQYLAPLRPNAGLLDLLRRPLIPLPRPLLVPHRTVVVEGNDVTATGPALLLLAGERQVIGALVTGNAFRSSGRTGAVYLRRVDATVLTGNRCEALAAVTVVVVRADRAPITVTGNVLLGAEPIAPIRPLPRPVAPAAQGPTLTLPVGAGGLLHVPFDAAGLLGALEVRKDRASEVFASVLGDYAVSGAEMRAEASLSELRMTRLALAAAVAPEDPELMAPMAPVPSELPARERTLVLREAAARERTLIDRLTITSRARRPAGDDATPVATERVPPARERTEQPAPMVVDTSREALMPALRAVYAAPAVRESSDVDALKSMADRMSILEPDGDKAKAKITALLRDAEGQPKVALALLDQQLLGIDSAAPEVRESMRQPSLVHEVLADALHRGLLPAKVRTPADLLRVPPRPLPVPRPQAKSLVIIGGSRVAVVGNSTTAGVQVTGAADVVELNP